MKSIIQKQPVMFSVSGLLLLGAALTTALITGLLYAYSCSVNPGLGRLPAKEYIAAMQSINRAIQNPLFFVSFFGPVILLPLSCYFHYQAPQGTRFYLLLAATILYLAGVTGVTVFGNIPLNEALDKFNLSNADPAETTRQQLSFMKNWNRFHTIRTTGSFFSLVLVLIACLYRDSE
jgi:uncharacterized membrane protein